MASIDAQNVAKEVLEILGKNKKIVLGKIIKKNGYAQNTADNPLNVTTTKSFQAVTEPVVKKWLAIRMNLTKELERKDLSEESMRDITDTLDKLTKNIQLLTGGETERGKLTIVEMASEIKKKNAIN